MARDSRGARLTVRDGGRPHARAPHPRPGRLLGESQGVGEEGRLSRPQGARLTEREEGRLRGLMRRSDVLGNALDALQNDETAYPDVMAEYVEVIREEFGQAHEAFSRYRAEVGIPDPVRKNARKPA